MLIRRKGKQALLFLQKKKQKNSYLLGALAAALQKPPASKSFLLLFFKKEALAFFFKLPRLAKSLARNTIILNRHRRQARRDHKTLTAIILTGRLGDIFAAHAALPGLIAPDRHLLWLVNPAYAGILDGNPAIHAAIRVTSPTEAMLLRFLSPKFDWRNLHIDKSQCPVFKFTLRNRNGFGIDLANFYNFGPLADIYTLLATGRKPAAPPAIATDESFDIPFYLSAIFKTPENPILAFHPVSEEPDRTWPASHADQLAAWLLANTAYNICEFGLTPHLPPGPRIATLRDTLSLPQQSSLMTRATLFVGVDSAFAHLANAHAIRAILLISRYRNFTTQLPWRPRPGDAILRAKSELSDITPDQVTAALRPREAEEASRYFFEKK